MYGTHLHKWESILKMTILLLKKVVEVIYTILKVINI